jgi:lysophospholipase L1-like esterase
MAINYQKSHNYVTCIDAGVGLLKDNGLPNFGYFLTDGLHMSKAGYVIWGKAVKDAVINWLGK